jgi:hypothetical protein
LLTGADVILSEVLEHIEKDEALKLLQALRQVEVNKLIITVPNKDFNEFYGMAETEFRHDDHKWEPTYDEWVKFLGDAAKTTGLYLTKFCKAGDVVITATENGGFKSASVFLLTVFSKE